MSAERPPLGTVTLPPSWSLSVVAETASTNTDLLAAAATGAPHGTVLVAEHQVAGRGRLDRSWSSPPRAGLTFSVLLVPGVPAHTWGWLPLLAGVALHDAVALTAGVDVCLKWPNDLLAGADRRKAAGILVQAAGAAVVVGIGLNVSTRTEELPVPTATSLAIAGAATVDRTALLTAILGELDRQHQRWCAADGDAVACGLAADYRDTCATLGEFVRVNVAGGAPFEGVATGVDADGRLRIVAGEQELVVAAGDVEHIRPATR